MQEIKTIKSKWTKKQHLVNGNLYKIKFMFILDHSHSTAKRRWIQNDNISSAFIVVTCCFNVQIKAKKILNEWMKSESEIEKERLRKVEVFK